MRFYTRKRRMPAVIIVSLIDILAILLIFVIVTTTFKRDQSAVVIKLPDSTTAKAQPATTEPAVLTITKEGKCDLDGKPVELSGLKQALREMLAATPGRALVVNEDKDSTYATFVHVTDTLKEAGVSNFSALTESK